MWPFELAVLTQPNAGPAAALSSRAASRLPVSDERSKEARSAAPARSPAARETAPWTPGNTPSVKATERDREGCSHPQSEAASSKTRCQAASKGARVGPVNGKQATVPPSKADCAMAAPETSAASASRAEERRKPKPPCRKGKDSCCTAAPPGRRAPAGPSAQGRRKMQATASNMRCSTLRVDAALPRQRALEEKHPK